TTHRPSCGYRADAHTSTTTVWGKDSVRGPVLPVFEIAVVATTTKGERERLCYLQLSTRIGMTVGMAHCTHSWRKATQRIGAVILG
ncbi:hypothetical protein ABTM54_19525, partial [Acinetobacter baumannii]